MASDERPGDVDGDAERSGPSWGLIASAVVVALIALLAVWIVTADDGDATSASSSPATSTTAPATKPTGSSDEDRGCSGLPVSAEVPASAPEVSWELLAGYGVPVSDASGPTEITATQMRCFARTPMGALAASRAITWGYLLSPERSQIIDEQIVEGPGRAALIEAVAAEGDARPARDRGCQLAGWRIYAATLDRVTGSAAERCQGELVATDWTVVWADGDWKLQLQPDGMSGVWSKLASLSGFVPMNGVGS